MRTEIKAKLVERVKTIEGLTDDERAALLELLRTNKTYGLVWENKPEDVEERLRDELPVLIEDTSKALTDGGDNAPNHVLIEGDNLEALTALSYTHAGKIDVIYIDPPYNTGNNDFIYNDNYVDREDAYRHSKWLSFMSKRLRIAKKLLSDRGVIFISIDDNEQANLKLLCDSIFGERNLICQFIWQQGKKSSGNLVGVNHEYVICYAKNREIIDNPENEWKTKKKGLQKIYDKYEELKRCYGSDFASIQRGIRLFFSSLQENDPAYGSKHYNFVDEYGLFFADNSCAPDKPENRCHKPLIHPITGKSTAVPRLGWRWKEETLDLLVNQGRIYFGDNENVVPKIKKYLKEMEYEMPSTVFYCDGRGASKELDSMFHEKRFNNPKDRNILAWLLNFRKNSTVLDFFAGSGTTLHAVMQLNADDGGNRKCILIQNNENSICEEVTYERNKRVINGYTKSNGDDVEGLHANNLRYYRTAFVGRERSPKNLRKLMLLTTDMLCIKEDLYNEVKTFAGQRTYKNIFRYFEKDNKHMMIIYDERYVPNLSQLIEKFELPKGETIKVYVFSPSEDPWTVDFESVASKVELCALPMAILNAYKRILPKRKERNIFVEETAQPEQSTQVNDENESENLGGLFATIEG